MSESELNSVIEAAIHELNCRFNRYVVGQNVKIINPQCNNQLHTDFLRNKIGKIYGIKIFKDETFYQIILDDTNSFWDLKSSEFEVFFENKWDNSPYFIQELVIEQNATY